MQHRKIKNRRDAEPCLNAASASVGAQTPTDFPPN